MFYTIFTLIGNIYTQNSLNHIEGIVFVTIWTIVSLWIVLNVNERFSFSELFSNVLYERVLLMAWIFLNVSFERVLLMAWTLVNFTFEQVLMMAWIRDSERSMMICEYSMCRRWLCVTLTTNCESSWHCFENVSTIGWRTFIVASEWWAVDGDLRCDLTFLCEYHFWTIGLRTSCLRTSGGQ